MPGSEDNFLSMLSSMGDGETPVSPPVSAPAPQTAHQAEPDDVTETQGAAEQPSTVDDWLTALYEESGLDPAESSGPDPVAVESATSQASPDQLTREQFDALPEAAKKLLMQAVSTQEWAKEVDVNLKRRRLEAVHTRQRQDYENKVVKPKLAKALSDAEKRVDGINYYAAESEEILAAKERWMETFNESARAAIAELGAIEDQPNKLRALAEQYLLEPEDVQEVSLVHPDDWDDEAAKLGRYREKIRNAQREGAATTGAATTLARTYAKDHMVRPAGTGKPKAPVQESSGSDEELEAFMQFNRQVKARPR